MMTKEAEEHKLTINPQDFLTALQRKILLFLAVDYPRTMNSTVRAMSGNYRSSWDAFKELEEKKLIKPVSIKFYKGRKYPQFWATENGILIAMSEGADPKILLRRTQAIYPDNKELQFLVETIPILGESAYNMLYLAVITNGKIEESDLISVFAAQKKLTEEEKRRYNEILKRYPERHKQHADFIKRARKNLKELSDMLDN
jgi:hypothetical protein